MIHLSSHKSNWSSGIQIHNIYTNFPNTFPHYRTNIFDQIAAVGGTLGLFTGVSIITFVEVFYWMSRFLLEMFRKGTQRVSLPLPGVAVPDQITGLGEGYSKGPAKANGFF